MQPSVLVSLLLICTSLVSTKSKSKVYMGFDGGYRGIVVKIDNHFDQDQPHDEIIDSIKVDRNSNKKRSICKSRYLVHL